MKPEDPKFSQFQQPDQSVIVHQERDRFELLSAYIDGEVTPKERQQVQQLLHSDPKTQKLYQRLLHLRQGLQTLPSPNLTTAPEDLASSVFNRIEKRQRRKVIWWSGSAIAAAVIGAVSLISGNSQTPVWQLAHNYLIKPEPEPLMIAVNRPIIEIPKASVNKTHLQNNLDK